MEFILKHFGVGSRPYFTEEYEQQGICDGSDTRFYVHAKNRNISCIFRITKVDYSLLWDYLKYKEGYLIEAYKEENKHLLGRYPEPLSFKEWMKNRK